MNTQSTQKQKPVPVPATLSEVPANTWAKMVERMMSGK
jgi:hypothetical protein